MRFATTPTTTTASLAALLDLLLLTRPRRLLLRASPAWSPGPAPGSRSMSKEQKTKMKKRTKMKMSEEYLNDQLSRTVNYAEVAQVVNNKITGEPRQLIESLAEDIANQILMLSGELSDRLASLLGDKNRFSSYLVR